MTDDAKSLPHRDMPKAAVILILWAWLALLALTHLGWRSPYSYGWAVIGNSEQPARIMGALVNPDALPLVGAAKLFYDATPAAGADNVEYLWSPFHPFVTSVMAGLTRSYLFASYFVNYLFAALVALAAVNAADHFAIRRPAALVALLSAFTLPAYVEYLGQPMYYVVAPAVSFLIVLSILTLPERDARNPWIAGLATALLLLSYDPYVLLTAVIAYFLFAGRFARARDYIVYLALAAAPIIVWVRCLRLVAGPTAGISHNTRQFLGPLMGAWVSFAKHPIHNALQPFVASHIGIHVAFREIVALIHWPLLVVCIALLIRLRPQLAPRLWIVALLPVAYVMEQMVVAAWDWELNPRRAIPVTLAFAVSYCYIVNAMWPRRLWRIAFITLFLFCGCLAMADTFTGSPVLEYLHSGQGVRDAPQKAIDYLDERLDRKETMPMLHTDVRPLIWHDLGRARLGTQRALFAVTQIFSIALVVALFWLTSRAGLLPRWTPVVAAVIWLASFARFL